MFLRARKWQQGLAAGEYSCWRLYADAAMLEWRRGRDAGAARNIFEKGLEDPRLFREPQFVLAYLDMLTGGRERKRGRRTSVGRPVSVRPRGHKTCSD